jgi:hypothetical protein
MRTIFTLANNSHRSEVEARIRAVGFSLSDITLSKGERSIQKAAWDMQELARPKARQ